MARNSIDANVVCCYEIAMYSPDEIDDVKIRFAAAILRNPGEIWRAASEVDARTEYQRYLVQVLAMDKDVNAHVTDLRRKDSVKSAVPTKDEFVLMVLQNSNDIRDKETKLKYLKLVAEMMGYIEKSASTVVTNNNAIKQTVMLVPIAQSADDWENVAVRSQAKLIDASAAS